jgi:hypothetical protein
MRTQQTENDEDDAFMRQVTWCEEDRLQRHPGVPWNGGYRWFRSPNIVPLERYRPSGWKWGDTSSRR